jgi:hypothetical protein
MNEAAASESVQCPGLTAFLRTPMPVGNILYLLLVFTVSCSHELGVRPVVNDGLYIVDDTAKPRFTILLKDARGSSRHVGVKRYSGFTIQQVTAFPLFPHEDGYQIQLDGTATDRTWNERELIIFVNGEAYFEIGKTGGTALSGEGPVNLTSMISFKIADKAKAELIRDNLAACCQQSEFSYPGHGVGPRR